jgi:hypothetical protein
MSASFARSRARQADLDQVGIPSVLGDTQVIIALLLGGVLTMVYCMHSRVFTFFAPCPKTWPIYQRQSRKRS